jgi:hypothetical protein
VIKDDEDGQLTASADGILRRLPKEPGAVVDRHRLLALNLQLGDHIIVQKVVEAARDFVATREPSFEHGIRPQALLELVMKLGFLDSCSPAKRLVKHDSLCGTNAGAEQSAEGAYIYRIEFWRCQAVKHLQQALVCLLVLRERVSCGIERAQAQASIARNLDRTFLRLPNEPDAQRTVDRRLVDRLLNPADQGLASVQQQAAVCVLGINAGEGVSRQ